jgi:hypothetical protein
MYYSLYSAFFAAPAISLWRNRQSCRRAT